MRRTKKKIYLICFGIMLFLLLGIYMEDFINAKKAGFKDNKSYQEFLEEEKIKQAELEKQEKIKNSKNNILIISDESITADSIIIKELESLGYTVTLQNEQYSNYTISSNLANVKDYENYANIIIIGGFYDYILSAEIGELNDKGTSTFCGILNNLSGFLKDKLIMVSSPYIEVAEINKKGFIYTDYLAFQKSICTLNETKFIDIYDTENPVLYDMENRKIILTDEMNEIIINEIKNNLN